MKRKTQPNIMIQIKKKKEQKKQQKLQLKS